MPGKGTVELGIEDKVGRGLPSPPGDRLTVRDSVKGAVYLDVIEVLGVPA